MTLFKRYIALLLIFIGIALLWNTVVMFPLKVFVVFMHEVSHGLAAYATGGSIVEIEINPQQGGHALTRGGDRFWTLTAGYLGSLLWGGIILLLAARTHLEKAISVLIGFGVVLIAAGLFLPEVVNDWMLRVIGVTSCLYAILDIKSDVLDRSHLRSDARMLAENYKSSDNVLGHIVDCHCHRVNLCFLYIAGNLLISQIRIVQTCFYGYRLVFQWIISVNLRKSHNADIQDR